MLTHYTLISRAARLSRRAHIGFYLAGVAALLAAVPVFAFAISSPADVVSGDSAQVFAAGCAALPRVSVGQEATMAAAAVGGEGHVTFRWLRDAEGEGEFLRPVFTTAGVKAVTAVASDATGRIAAATCFVEVTSPIPAAVPQAPSAPTEPARKEVSPEPEEGMEAEREEAAVAEEGETEDDGISVGTIIMWIAVAAVAAYILSLFLGRGKGGTGLPAAKPAPSGEKKGMSSSKESGELEGRASGRTHTEEKPPLEAYTDADREEGEREGEEGEHAVASPLRGSP